MCPGLCLEVGAGETAGSQSLDLGCLCLHALLTSPLSCNNFKKARFYLFWVLFFVSEMKYIFPLKWRFGKKNVWIILVLFHFSLKAVAQEALIWE